MKNLTKSEILVLNKCFFGLYSNLEHWAKNLDYDENGLDCEVLQPEEISLVDSLLSKKIFIIDVDSIEFCERVVVGTTNTFVKIASEELFEEFRTFLLKKSNNYLLLGKL